MPLIYVKAASGLNVPKEGNPRAYITDGEPVPVEGTHYYRKAVLDGDLVELSDKEFADYQAKADAAAKATAKAAAKAASDAAQ